VRPPQGKSLSESAFLQEQAANAKAAIAQALSDAKNALAEGVSIREWTARYPWIALGGAAVAGFVAASTLIPTKEQQALKKLAEYERALHPERFERQKREKDQETELDEHGKIKNKKPGMMQTIISELIRSVGPALASSLTAGLATQAQQPETSNGHEAPTGA
jgi:hypothetical protein